MKQTGLDTSVVLRLLVGEPREQAERAIRFLDELHAAGKRAVVSDLVIAEAYFALSYHYNVPKQEAVEKLLEFLDSGYAQPEPNAVAVGVMKDSAGAKPGLVDRIIRSQYLKYAEEVATFDKSLGRMQGVVILAK